MPLLYKYLAQKDIDTLNDVLDNATTNFDVGKRANQERVVAEKVVSIFLIV